MYAGLSDVRQSASGPERDGRRPSEAALAVGGRLPAHRVTGTPPRGHRRPPTPGGGSASTTVRWTTSTMPGLTGALEDGIDLENDKKRDRL